MKIGLIVGLVLLLTSFKVDEHLLPKRSSKWVISENSSLVVKGSTNVNHFSCAILTYSKTDTLLVSQDQQHKLLFSGELNIEVKNFDCHNLMMTKQLRKTLKEERFPNFKIRFLSLKETSVLGQHRNLMNGLVEISIAGITKRFEINYQLNMDKNTMELTGNQIINFSDFNLEPPKKMGKLIQAKDELTVVFCLKMETTS